ncbi:MAG TPA: ABC transporter permease subunit [Herpetosiphonaceae bacterium]
MLRSVFAKSLYDQRRSLIGWALGLVVMILIVMAAYPAVRDNPAIGQVLEELPQAIVVLIGDLDIVSAAGYLNSRLFTMILPLMFLIYGIGRGAQAIAGEEERKTLDLLLAYPLDRKRVVAEKFLALCTLLVALGMVAWLAQLVGVALVDMPISAGRLAGATFNAVLLGLLFGALALALGCATGRRGLSVGVSTALGIAGFFIHGLAPLVEQLEFAQKLSPFYYYIGNDPLRNGLDPLHVGVLSGTTFMLLLLALISFSRRDVAV